ncbi:DUF4325 domain-containing protein [Candidatus Uhrbacteria bacterium]|nr:DUF4325 domain-containing protein [Candidatus Uhrbacteria bacterium]
MSRQSGKEALLALRPQLNELKSRETIEVDFEGVTTFSPSWGDEFLTPLLEEYADRLILYPTDNFSVQDTLALLEDMHGYTFKIDT